MKTTPFKTLTLRPLTGPLDCRSSPDEVSPDSFRMKLNMAVSVDRKLSRRAGHRRLMASSGMGNWDWHDQGYCNTTIPVRESAYLLREATSTTGTRRLYVGKRDQLFVLATNLGKWIPLMSAGIYGGDTSSGAYWEMATLGDYAIFHNKVDPPLYHRMGAQPSFCGEPLVAEIPELRDTVKLSRAGVVETFNGTVFVMDTVENGTRYPSRVRWSALNSVLKWTATLNAQGVASNISGYQDLPYGERIIAAKELQGNLYIFTETGIWRCFVAGGDGVYGFTPIYTDRRNRSKCLKYPRTLVSDGADLYYFSSEGIYRYNPYAPVPSREEWIHKASKLLFDELDTACCDGPVGGILADNTEIHWSYTRAGDGCLNSRTFVINTSAHAADYMDHGFTAYANFRPDTRITLAEWLDSFCTTDFAGMCSALGNRSAADFCNECQTEQLLVAASADDLCIKELNTAYSRERCTNVGTATGSFDGNGDYQPFTATYALDGYFSLVRGVFPLGNMDHDKFINRFTLEYDAAFQLADPAQVRLRLGTSHRAVEPNPDGKPFAFAYNLDSDLSASVSGDFSFDGPACSVLWDNQEDQNLSCPESEDSTDHRLNFTRASIGMDWSIYNTGRFLYYEIAVIGKDGAGEVVPPTGGESNFSRVEVGARIV